MEAGEVERCSPVTCGALMGFPVICWGLFRFRQTCEGTAVEKRLPCVYVAFLIVTLLLIPRLIGVEDALDQQPKHK